MIIVEELSTGKARIGVNAPEDVLIAREELLEKNPDFFKHWKPHAVRRGSRSPAPLTREDVAHPDHPAIDLLS